MSNLKFVVIAIATGLSLPAVGANYTNDMSECGADAFARRIEVRSTTKWINVNRYEMVQLVNESGAKFVRRFDDALHVVPLKRIAPDGFLPGSDINVYIMNKPQTDG